MAHSLPDARSVVAELGGAKPVSELFGVTENAVWNWTAANRFPAHTYFTLRDELKARRKAAPEDLWKRPLTGASLPAVVSPSAA